MTKNKSLASIGIRRLINTIRVSRKAEENNLTIQNVEKMCNEELKKYKNFLNDDTCGGKPPAIGQKIRNPTLKSIIDQPYFKASYIPGELKIMGENYNPFNYNLDKMISTIRRNDYGSLFQH